MTKQTPPPAMRALRATYTEARQGRETVESLTPLLALLEPQGQDEGGPLDDVTALLQTILATQERTLAAIESLASKLDGETRR